MSQKVKNIILGIALVVVLFIGYSLFFPRQAEGPLLVSLQAPAGGQTVVQEFLALLETLNNLRLDTTIFEDRVFNSLKDESVQLQEEPRGRRNPFGPL